MSYAIRNSIVLLVFLLLVILIGGYFYAIKQPALINEYEERIAELDRELDKLPGLIAEYNRLTGALEIQRKRWQERDKDIAPADITGDTYDFLNRSIDRSGGFVKLDMLYGGAESRNQYGYNIYNLRGEAPFPIFYRFLWFVENGRRLYRIHQMNLRGVETRDPETELPVLLVTFDMQMRGYFTGIQELHTSTAPRPVRPNVIRHNPYYPLILSDIPPNVDDLIESERSELLAVVPGRAILLDHNRRIQTVQEGDSVYLGYVSKIIPEESRIEFTLNKGGIIERFNLYIRYNEQNKTR